MIAVYSVGWGRIQSREEGAANTAGCRPTLDVVYYVIWELKMAVNMRKQSLYKGNKFMLCYVTVMSEKHFKLFNS